MPGLETAMPGVEINRLELRSDLSELRRLAEWISGHAPDVISTDTMFAVELALEEAVANIIMHGGARDDRLAISVELEANGATLVARIEDAGCEFDPTQYPPLFMAKSLEDAKFGGYGIQLMRCFATAMHYERHEGRNRLTLRFAERH